MSDLRRKSTVTHLMFWRDFQSMATHEFRSLYSFTSSRLSRTQDHRTTLGTLWSGQSGETFRLSTTIHLHGVRAIDLERGFARHRDMFECETRSSLPLGFWRTGGSLDSGRRQRGPRLADVAGLGKRTDQQGPKALCRRGSWS